MNLLRRYRNFKAETEWLSNVMGGKKPAARYLLASRSKKKLVLGEGQHGHLPIVFRRADLPLLKRILIDRKYAFLKPYVSNNNLINVIDVGAHIGTFALWLLAENAQADIFSVEADPDSFAILKKNREPAAHYGHAWRILNRAAWKEEIVIPFSRSKAKINPKGSGHDHIKVLGVPLQALAELTKYDQIHLMKVNIRGAEEAFLTSNPDLLKKIDMLVVEIYPKASNENAIRACLSEHYQVVEDVPKASTTSVLLFCRKYADYQVPEPTPPNAANV